MNNSCHVKNRSGGRHGGVFGDRAEISLLAYLREEDPVEIDVPMHLQRLSITTEGIRSIPEDIKNLEMSHTSGLEGFPMAVCELNKLTQLILSGNEKIKEVPPREHVAR